MTIGKALKTQRLLNGYTQSSLAKATGLKQQMISWWEADKGLPNIEFCIQLANFYDISVDELIGLSDSIPTAKKQNLPTTQQSNTLSFANEYADLIEDQNFIKISKLYNAITPELRALALGYIVGILQKNGVNTKKILGY